MRCRTRGSGLGRPSLCRDGPRCHAVPVVRFCPWREEGKEGTEPTERDLGWLTAWQAHSLRGDVVRGTEFPGRTYVPFSPRRRSGLISRAIPIRFIRRAQTRFPRFLFSGSRLHTSTQLPATCTNQGHTHTIPPFFSFLFFTPHGRPSRALHIKSTFSPSRSGGSEASSPSADGLEHPSPYPRA